MSNVHGIGDIWHACKVEGCNFQAQVGAELKAHMVSVHGIGVDVKKKPGPTRRRRATSKKKADLEERERATDSTVVALPPEAPPNKISGQTKRKVAAKRKAGPGDQATDPIEEFKHDLFSPLPPTKKRSSKDQKAKRKATKPKAAIEERGRDLSDALLPFAPLLSDDESDSSVRKKGVGGRTMTGWI